MGIAWSDNAHAEQWIKQDAMPIRMAKQINAKAKTLAITRC